MKFLIVLIIPVFISSCGYLHTPTSQYIVENNKKGQVHMNASINYLQLGYNINDKWNVFITGNRRQTFGTTFGQPENSGSDISNDKSEQFYLGFGTFASNYKIVKKLFLHYNVQYGVGKGNIDYYRSTNYSSYTYTNLMDNINISAKNYNLFIQPIFGLKLKNFFWGISHMVEYKRYYDIKTKFEGDKYPYEDLFIKNKSVYGIIYEPALVFKFGGEKVKFQAQVMSSFKLVNTTLNNNALKVYVGVYINPFTIFKENKTIN